MNTHNTKINRFVSQNRSVRYGSIQMTKFQKIFIRIRVKFLKKKTYANRLVLSFVDRFVRSKFSSRNISLSTTNASFMVSFVSKERRSIVSIIGLCFSNKSKQLTFKNENFDLFQDEQCFKRYNVIMYDAE